MRAFYLAEVERALPKDIERIDHPRQDLSPRSQLPFDEEVRLAFATTPPEKPLPNLLDTPEAKALVSAAGTRHITPKALGDVLECPFRFVAGSALQLRPNRRRSRWHHLYRLPSRTGLASLPSRESAEHAMRAALEDELNKLFADATQDDLALMRAGGERMIGEWLDREFASRTLWPRDSTIHKPSFERGHLRSKIGDEDGHLFLQGELPAISQRNGYKVLHLFRASEPLNNSQHEEDPWDRLSEKDTFELGLYLAALYNPNDPNVGIEIDSASGARNLFLMPRPTAEDPVRSDQARSFKVTVIEEDRRRDIFRQVRELTLKALRRNSSGDG